MIKYTTNQVNGTSCMIGLFVIFINMILGGMSVNYILSWFDKDIPFVADALIGLFTGEISIPVAVVGWILKSLGVF